MDPITVETQGFQFLSSIALIGSWIYVIKAEKWMGFIFVIGSLIVAALGLALSLVSGPLGLIFGTGILSAAIFLFWSWATAIFFITLGVVLFSFGQLSYSEAFRRVIKAILGDFIQCGLILILSGFWVNWVFFT
ncbi:hypothetical protein A2V49_00515 [candidate division WWE3 bacterium RBG_19FT_COMBO_34_6]|uniref:Uncharacterized protein n=1 Tax=candidate division WWE3 bacterium RBG_19FT_COMBO_34_6 TaxID=1802612 RepID=A0A1F4UNJ1_UNCKA|nr:MAG: hypothetical protein A2V49_00515 [candidate division WWE3 bacterium RBG_19FT_COMBO_34_6]